MYEFENRPVTDGDTAFGIEGTARINNKIYVLAPEADELLLAALVQHDYLLEKSKDQNFFHARKAHQQTRGEMEDRMFAGDIASPLSLIINLIYADGHKHSLTEADIHRTILSSASQRSDLNYYNREQDRFNVKILNRMSAFVQHMVDVDYIHWEAFLRETQGLHAQDFIKSMAVWASRHSDQTARSVKLDTHSGQTITVHPADQFIHRARNAGVFRFDI